MGHYPGIVLGESTAYTKLMQGTVYKVAGVIENGVYQPDSILGEIEHYYDWIESEEETDVVTLLRKIPGCYGLAWEEPMLHKFTTCHEHPQLLKGKYNFYFLAELPYSFIYQPSEETIRYQLLRAKNDLRWSNKAFLVSFHC